MAYVVALYNANNVFAGGVGESNMSIPVMRG
jgi:hypothetical protein